MQKSNFWSILLLENDINCFLRASWKNMILKWESYSESDFQVKFYNVSDFQLNFWNVSEIEKNLHSEIHVLNYVTLWNWRFCIFRAAGKYLILKWHFYDAPHFETKYYNVWDFELNIFKRVRNWKKVWIKKNHVMNQGTPRKRRFLDFSGLSGKHNFGETNLQTILFSTKTFTTIQILQLKF